ncbi:unnamed protein product [Lactuca virosa]|uniref:Malic enzyme N-terminal domain-containing protein n=1 Tax=Lactuca virosa TaxID=75947 RepID=A0AAU9P7U4_9ASTR|nr:unnamed protein product [Lactuca virosa]
MPSLKTTSPPSSPPKPTPYSPPLKPTLQSYNDDYIENCSRAMGDGNSAVGYFDESVNFLSKVGTDDLEVAHTLSVSLNKIGDLKYYEGDLKAARDHYFRALDILDVDVSLAKVADVDRNLDAGDTTIEGFQEAINLLESLNIKSEETALEQRVLPIMIDVGTNNDNLLENPLYLARGENHRSATGDRRSITKEDRPGPKHFRSKSLVVSKVDVVDDARQMKMKTVRSGGARCRSNLKHIKFTLGPEMFRRVPPAEATDV